MINFINMMQNTLVNEESSVEDSFTLEEVSPTLEGPGSSKSLGTSVTFSEQVKVAPVVAQPLGLRDMGYTSTAVTQIVLVHIYRLADIILSYIQITFNLSYFQIRFFGNIMYLSY